MTDLIWCVALAGHNFDLEELRQRLEGFGGRIEIVRDEYRLYSEHFAGLETDLEVNAVAQEIIALLNLAGILRVDSFEPVRFARAIQIDQDGKERHFLHFSDSIRMRASMHAEVVRSDGTKEILRPASLTPLIAALRSNHRIARAALYVLRKPNWYGYYKAFEAVRKHVGGHKRLLDRGWYTKPQLDRFTMSAQPIRHDRGHGPTDPMSEAEGRHFVLGLIQRVIVETEAKLEDE